MKKEERKKCQPFEPHRATTNGKGGGEPSAHADLGQSGERKGSLGPWCKPEKGRRKPNELPSSKSRPRKESETEKKTCGVFGQEKKWESGPGKLHHNIK